MFFLKCVVVTFGFKWQSHKSAVAKMALKLLIPFPTTYECEKAFSTLVTNKTKSRNRDVGTKHDVKIALANTQPNIKELLKTSKCTQLSELCL